MAMDINLDALFEPLFLEPFVVQRRKETIGTNGRVNLTTSSVRTSGTIVAASPDDLERLESYQITGRAIKITSTYPIQGEVVGYQPDIIVWRGTNYVVKTIDYLVQYGRGFYEVLATSIDKNDNAFVFLGPSEFKFNAAVNSQLISVM